MSEPNEPQGGSRDAALEEEQVRRLLERAGPRPEVPPDDLAAIQRAFRAEWQEHVRAQGRRDAGAPGSERARRFPVRDRRLLALAAMVLIALGLGWWWSSLGPPVAPGPAATVERVAGAVTARPPGDRDGAAGRLAPGAEVPPGTELETAGEGALVALRLGGGSSLRLDAGSRVRLVSASTVELVRGAVYVDSGGGEPRRGQAVAVRTSLGVATDVGTQFEVRLLEPGAAALRVRVREGAVRIEGEGAELAVDAGAELTLHADGSVTRRPVVGHGEAWSWVLAAAPPFEIEGETLAAFLDWAARENGWTVRYADPELEAVAGTIELHGGIGHLTPAEAPGVVLPGAGLEHRVVDGVLIVGE